MTTPAARSRIADPALSADGHRAIEWAEAHSPVLNGHIRGKLGDGSLEGRRVAVVVHLEAKTAFLATVLADAGADVVVAGSNPWTTRDDVAAALVDRGIEVHSSRLSSVEQWEDDLAEVIRTEPELVVDDGAELTVRMARDHADIYSRVRGVSEETTTGVDRLRRLEARGHLPMPAIAANDAACKHMFDNRYGTGQSSIQAILQLTNLRMPGKRLVVVGYGWVGRGIAMYARAMGARVIAVDRDPIKALEAHTDGHDVADLTRALAEADLVITATGGLRAIGRDHFPVLAANVILANTGHHDHEIDVPALEEAATDSEEVRPGVTRYRLGERDVFVLSGGALVNIAGGLGHPIEIMDLSFSVQALGCHTLASSDLPPGVHGFPVDLDREIATAKLASQGIALGAVDERSADTLDDLLPGGST